MPSSKANPTFERDGAKARRILPTYKVREKVMAEFRHLCAVCGKHSPQIHHIDGDKNNNELLNLLPLCPNHHLLDAHSPTEAIPPLKMKLFRRFKDPSIFLPQFHPVFERLFFLLNADSEIESDAGLGSKASDLLDFISHLQMGAYYAPRIKKLIEWRPPSRRATRSASQGMPVYVRPLLDMMQDSEYAKTYPQVVLANREEAIKLVIECVRYQAWRNQPPFAEA